MLGNEALIRVVNRVREISAHQIPNEGKKLMERAELRGHLFNKSFLVSRSPSHLDNHPFEEGVINAIF